MTDWTLSFHAAERMEERGVTQDQLDALLAQPAVSLPDPQRDPTRRMYTGGGLVAVVNETTREVVTVGIIGASNRDWESFAAPQSGTLPAEPVPHRKRRRRVKDAEPPVTRSNVLDGVHESIADGVRAYLAAHGLDFRAVRVLGPMQVEINPPKR